MPPANAERVNLPSARFILAISVFAALQYARGQQAVSPIEQARLFQELPTTASTAVDANGMAVGDDDTSSDDSFGKQLILKSQPRVRTFVISGDASVFYTDNVALTRRDKIADAFAVANAGVTWSPRINSHLEAQFGAHASIFRYNSTSALDFENLGLGAGLFWSPDHVAGISFFGRYDFIELLNRHSEEILRDHEFTLGAQKIFAFGRAHSLVAGAAVMAGLSTPHSAQRDQAGIFLAYRLQVTRSLEVEILYRFAGNFYNDSGRVDRNQVLSATVRYRVREWADINAFFSLADNRSDDSAFDYDAAVNGGGVGVTIRY